MYTKVDESKKNEVFSNTLLSCSGVWLLTELRGSSKCALPGWWSTPIYTQIRSAWVGGVTCE
jgi:hypothetical protein